MNDHPTLNWKSLTEDEIAFVEQTALRLEQTQSESLDMDTPGLECEPKLIPYIKQRAKEHNQTRQVASTTIDPSTKATLPSEIGPIHISKVICRGTSADVYLGRQEDPPRDVAVKLLHRGGDLKKVEEGFRREVRFLAKLDHPGIAKVYFADTTNQYGHPLLYYVMEYVDGPNLTQYAYEQALSIEQKVQLFLKVCGAIGHAHQNAILHRDLKPWNILTTRDGVPKLLDFGIAKTLEGTGTAHSQYGLGSPGYMAPEQFSTSQSQDTRSDIFSLGVILYELLTGQLPFSKEVVSLVDAAEAVAKWEIVPVAKRCQDCSEDLAAIVHTCLQKQANDRYQSVQELEDDLNCLLRDEPVKARPLSSWENLLRSLEQHRVPVLAFAFALSCILAVALLATVFWQRAESSAEQLERTVDSLRHSREVTEAVQKDLRDELKYRRRSAVNNALANADRSWRHTPELVYGWLTDREIFRDGMHGFAHQLQLRRAQRLVQEIHTSSTAMTHVFSAPSRNWIYVGNRSGEIQAWDCHAEKKISSFQFRIKGMLSCGINRSGDRLIVASNDRVVLIDALSGDTVREVSDQYSSINSVGFTSDSERIFIVHNNRSLSLWNSDLTTVLHKWKTPVKRIINARETTYSDSIMIIGNRGQVFSKSLTDDTVEQIWGEIEGNLLSTDLSPDGRMVATAGLQSRLRLGEAIANRPVLSPRSSNGRFHAMAFSADGNYLLTLGRDQLHGRRRDMDWAKEWTLFFDKPPTCLHRSGLAPFQFLVGFEDGTVRSYRFQSQPIQEVLLDGIAKPSGLAVHPTGKTVGILGKDFREYDLQESKILRKTPAVVEQRSWIRYGENDEIYQMLPQQNSVLVLNPNATVWDDFDRLGTETQDVAIDAQQNRILSACSDGDVEMLDPATGRVSSRFRAHDSAITTITYHPRSNRLATGDETGEIALWDENLKLLVRTKPHTGKVCSLVFSPNGKLLFSTGHDHTVGRVSVDQQAALKPIQRWVNRIQAVDVSSDSQTLAVCTDGNAICLCDALTGDLQCVLPGHSGTVVDVKFTNSPSSLLSLSRDGTLCRWSVNPANTSSIRTGQTSH